MSITYLELVNQVNSLVNEVELTPANFDDADGFYKTAKNAVNWSIKRITQQEFEWPFYNVQETISLVPGQTRYTPPTNCKSIDFDTFRLVGTIGGADWTLGGGVWDDSLPWDDTQIWVDSGSGLTATGKTAKLVRLDYDEYISKYIAYEYDREKDSFPRAVYQTQDRKFGFYPTPDRPYTVVYEYFSYPETLEAHADTPLLPESFDRLIVDGAMIYVYRFRGDIETSDRLERDFNQALKDLRKIYINRHDAVRSTMIPQPQTATGRYI
jgi:hypothetical protein